MGLEIDTIPPEQLFKKCLRGWKCVYCRPGGRNLLVLFKFSEYRLELRKLFWSDTRKRHSKTLVINPTHSGFIDPQRPIKAWNVESAFELRTLLHFHVAFDFTTAGRYIQSSPLPFLPLPRKGAAKLRGESRFDTSVLWSRF
ncbi:MAG: hypothetical protein OJF50_003834 [Nitrospira sp.]|nr:hypothetical protein [Nitrospira sp.]